MSFVAAIAGAAVVARPVAATRAALKVSTNVCNAVGALTIGAFGAGVYPFVQARAPVNRQEHDDMRAAFRNLIGQLEPEEVEIPPGLFRERGLRFDDLNRDWLFDLFSLANRTVFAVYADATGVMTPIEFRCALHKMIDLTLSWYGGEDRAPESQAVAVRKLLEKVADGAFKVIDTDDDGSINAHEFTFAVLLVLAVANGKVCPESLILKRLAFRVVDTDGNNIISEAELVRWVELALKHGTAPTRCEYEPRGPWGIFGTRILTPAKVARKWFRSADPCKSGGLSQEEFATIAANLQVHEVIRRLATRFSI